MPQIEKIKELSQMMRANGIKILELKEQGDEMKIELFPLHEGETISQPLADYEIIIAPILGIGYSFPPNRNKPFVSVGDKVEKGSVLCIIEVMKVMNEITADYDCEILEVCFENGAIVEFGQTLFKVKRMGALNAY